MHRITKLFAFSVLVLLARPTFAAGPNVKLEMQVTVLESLHGFDCTDDQLRSIDKIATDVKPATAPAKAKLSPAYITALTAARDALYTDDDDKISDAEENLDTVREQENMTPGPALDVTDSARHAAVDVLAILRPSQIAGYLADHADDVPDPLQTIGDALDQIDGKPEAEFQSIRQEAAEQVAVLLAGTDPAAQAPVIKQVDALLDEAHKLSSADLKTKRSALDTEAVGIVKHPDPLECLRHWLQRELADLMTNPELRIVIAERLKNK